MVLGAEAGQGVVQGDRFIADILDPVRLRNRVEADGEPYVPSRLAYDLADCQMRYAPNDGLAAMGPLARAWQVANAADHLSRVVVICSTAQPPAGVRTRGIDGYVLYRTREEQRFPFGRRAGGLAIAEYVLVAGSALSPDILTDETLVRDLARLGMGLSEQNS